MIKIIASSYHIWTELSIVNFSKCRTTYAILRDKDCLELGFSDGYAINLSVESVHGNIGLKIDQTHRRWDFAYNLLRHTQEQPAVIAITEETLRISFDY